VGIVGGNSAVGAGAYAGGDVRGHAYAAAPPPNARVGPGAGCGTGPRAEHDDIVIQGPGAEVDVTLHLRFHANIHQHWDSGIDLPVGAVESPNMATFFYTVPFGGATQQLTANVSRSGAGKTAQVALNPNFPPANIKVVPLPRHPEDASI